MKTFSVSLLVHSSSLTLDELSLKLGRPHSSGSYTKGQAHILKERPPAAETRWRFGPDTPESAALEKHLANLAAQFPPEDLQAVLPADCDVWVDIAIFFDTVNGSASIPHSAVKIVDAYKARLEVTCYPSWAPLEEKRKSS